MKEQNDIPYKFIKEMDYMGNSNIVGVVLFGSYLTEYSNKNSDIDIMVITDDSTEGQVRGLKHIDNKRIEYFERPLKDIYKATDNDFENQKNATLHIIGNGKILYDKDGRIKQLQNYVLQKNNNPLPPISELDAKSLTATLTVGIGKIESALQRNDPLFDYNFYILINEIRQFYHRLMGCAKIPSTAVFRMYTEEKYRDFFCIPKIPDKEFIELFFAASLCKGTNHEKFEKVLALFDYATSTVKLDKFEYRIQYKWKSF